MSDRKWIEREREAEREAERGRERQMERWVKEEQEENGEGWLHDKPQSVIP